jgi:hypothetical protein
MAHIKTVYRTDGTKERTPVGYGGGLCHAAAKPYEKREANFRTDMTPTPEALQDPVVPVAAEERRGLGLRG